MTAPLSDAEYRERWIARVLANTERTDSGCLIWKGSVGHNGYGQSGYRGRTIRVHRQLLHVLKGPLAPHLDACHSCDVRLCIEPSHLWPGTRKQNLVDCLDKGRHYRNTQTHCKHGHEFTPENTEWRKSGGGRGIGRACKACARARQRIKLGWDRDAAMSMPVIPLNAATPRRWAKRLSPSENAP